MIDHVQATGPDVDPRLAAVQEQILVGAAALREQLSEGQAKLRELIIKDPARALGIALGVGVLLGWLIKRR